jgi:hypothetical protein
MSLCAKPKLVALAKQAEKKLFKAKQPLLKRNELKTIKRLCRLC